LGLRVRKVGLDDLDGTYCCMSETPPSAGWAEALPDSREWFRRNLGRHVEGYHLLDNGKVVGHVYYASSERALVPFRVESGVAFVYCTEMLRDYMRKGYGRMMLDFVKDDLKKQGLKGILVDASDFESYMHHGHFEKQGFKVVREHGPFKLMYFPLNQESVEAEPLGLSYEPSRDRVEVTLFRMFFCPVGAYMYQMIKRVAESFGDKVRVVEVELTLENVRKYGTSDPLVNGKLKLLGPASEADVRKAIQEEIDQLKP